MRCARCGASLDPLPDPAVFDDRRRLVSAGAEVRRVGAQPYRVIEILRGRIGRRVSKSWIHEHLPGSPGLRAVDAYIHRARRALEGTPYRIETVRGGDVLLSRRTQPGEPAGGQDPGTPGPKGRSSRV